MNIGVYKGAAALGAYEKWQEIISQNLAAGSVPGYKRNEMSFEAVSTDDNKPGAPAKLGDSNSGVMPKATSKINFAQGDLQHTGADYDFAIQGSGFFQIKSAKGDMGYTRDGQFQIGPDLTLKTKQGSTVMGEGGPITFKPGGGPISINAEGMIFQKDQPVAKLSVYDFKDPQKLQRVGEGLLAPPEGGEQPQAVQKPSVASGFIEGSNVSPMTEMVNLITVSRAYEASQKVIQTNDDNTDKAIQTLGNPTA
jgi:flagellar basal-body rod protein FlgF